MASTASFLISAGETFDPTTEAAVVQSGGGSLIAGGEAVTQTANAHDSEFATANPPPQMLDIVGITIGDLIGDVSYTTVGSADYSGSNNDGLGGLVLGAAPEFGITLATTNPLFIGASGATQPGPGTTDVTASAWVIGVSGTADLVETQIVFRPPNGSLIGNGGTMVLDLVLGNAPFATDGFVDESFQTVSCFTLGTSIRAPGGERAVETLAVGDLVTLHTGGVAAVTWVGRQTVDLAAHAAPWLVRPVVIRAGALADGVPSRTLVVSPDHALLLDGRLIPAKLLVNGASIAQDGTAGSVTYVHFAVAGHGIVLAENTPAETFLGDEERARPERVDQAVWDHHASRAGASPVPEAGRPMPTILAEGRALEPIEAGPSRRMFAIPSRLTAVVIASPTSVPAATRPWRGDNRRLGVPVTRIVIRRDGRRIDIPMDSPVFGAGWHRPESDAGGVWRWTSGHAALPVSGGDVVEVTFGH